MSGIGHLAAGFASRPYTPKVPLLVLLAASETNEILYFLFTLTGVEQAARISMSFSEGVRHLDATTNPWSHGLFMSVIWAALAAGIAYLVYRDQRSAGMLGLVVFSHWVLDFLMHSNLPVFFEGSPLIGVGLEDTGAGFIFMTLLDLALLGGAVALYMNSRKKADGPARAASRSIR
jgi:membrane-bound metal-dependent hydrolase YbcI (DUF457 family)